MSHVTYAAWREAYIHDHATCHAYTYVTSHIPIRHVSYINEWTSATCHAHERVMSHIWMRHVTYMNESCHTHASYREPSAGKKSCKCGIAHVWTSHFTHMYESCHTSENIMSHIWMSPVTHVHLKGNPAVAARARSHVSESYHTYKYLMSHLWSGYATYMNAW